MSPFKALNVLRSTLKSMQNLMGSQCNKNLDRDQAGHFPVGLVLIARKLWEEKPIKKRAE